jgi:transposase
VVAKSYIDVDRDQQFLLPPDMREWLAPGHLVWLIADVVAALDTSTFHGTRRRRSTKNSNAGRRGYDPDMMLVLMLYAYCVGERSSRAIERRCHTDVAFRIACAQRAPDHTVIARFRQEHESHFTSLFSQVLLLCAAAGMVKVGTIAIDGTKIEANASIDANKTEARLRAMAQEIVDEAAAVDEHEDRDDPGDSMPPRLASPSTRAAALAEALESIDLERRERPSKEMRQTMRRVERAEAKEQRLTEEATARYDAQQQKLAQGKKLGARRAAPPDSNAKVLAARENLVKARAALALRRENESVKKRNLTDPQSRLMKTRFGFRQAYNAQLAVSEDHLILGAYITDRTVDVGEYIPTVAEVHAILKILAAAGHHREVGTVLADAGYFSTENLTAPGPNRLIAPGKAKDVAASKKTTVTNAERYDRTAIEEMQERIGTDEGTAHYRKRAGIIEPINAHLKDRRGLRRFARRGLTAAQSELTLAATATNLLRYVKITNLATI